MIVSPSKRRPLFSQIFIDMMGKGRQSSQALVGCISSGGDKTLGLICKTGLHMGWAAN